MGYDTRAVKVHKSVKVMATLMFNKEQTKFFIKEYARVLEKAAKSRTAFNRGEKVDD